MNSLLRVCPWHDHVLIMKTTITSLSFSFFLFFFGDGHAAYSDAACGSRSGGPR